MAKKEKKEAIQNYLLQLMVTGEGKILTRLYYNSALYSGERKVSLKGMLEMLGIKNIWWCDVVIYSVGSSISVPEVDRHLQTEYEQFRRRLLITSSTERKVLERNGTSAGVMVFNAMSR